MLRYIVENVEWNSIMLRYTVENVGWNSIMLRLSYQMWNRTQECYEYRMKYGVELKNVTFIV